MPSMFEKSIKQEIGVIIADAIKEDPRAPHKTGHLWRSQKIELPGWITNLLDVEFGFDTPYAAKLHEGMVGWNWTLKGSGPKFLEAKLIKNGKKYYANVTVRVKNQGKGKDV